MKTKLLALSLAVTMILSLCIFTHAEDFNDTVSVNASVGVKATDSFIGTYNASASKDSTKNNASFDFRCTVDMASVKDKFDYYKANFSSILAGGAGALTPEKTAELNAKFDEMITTGTFILTVNVPNTVTIPEKYLASGNMEGFDDNAKLLIANDARSFTDGVLTVTLTLNPIAVSELSTVFSSDLTLDFEGVTVTGFGSHNITAGFSGETLSCRRDSSGTPNGSTTLAIAYSAESAMSATASIIRAGSGGGAGGGSTGGGSTGDKETETVVNPDGSKTTTTTASDGSTTSTTVDKSGSSAKVEADKNGNISSVSVTVSDKAVKDSDTVVLPVVVEAAKSEDKAKAPKITLSVPKDTETAIEIPVENLTNSTVIVMVNPDGSEKIVEKSAISDGKIVLPVDGDVTFKVVDNSKEFKDVEGHWAENAIEYASSHELLKGTDNGVFDPEVSTNRAMVATILWRLEGEMNATGTATDAFADVSGTYYSDAVKWNSENGIVTGYDDGTFRGNSAVTREELATMLSRYAKLLNISKTATAKLTFTDTANVSDWAVESLEWAVGAGLIKGRDDGTLDPKGNATRAEVAVVMQRLISLIVVGEAK